jgi:hypothetical protein
MSRKLLHNHSCGAERRERAQEEYVMMANCHVYFSKKSVHPRSCMIHDVIIFSEID